MTINQIVFNFLQPLIPSGINGFYYLENNNSVKAPYSTIFQIDDPKERALLCPDDEGQTRFQIDVFDLYHDTGIDYRQSIQEACEGLRGYSESGFDIWNAQVFNVSDSPNTVNNLFQFSFELVVNWRK